MPLQKLALRPGINKENTRYSSEGGWYDCDKVRFRHGTPEKIGGWSAFSSTAFAGVCRSLWNWVTLTGANLVGVGTEERFYILRGGVYYDVTPIRETVTLTTPFSATNGSAVITVADASHGCITGDTVTFSGAGITGLGGNITAGVLTGSFTVTVVDANTYTITVSATANATDASGSPGGGSVVAQYNVNGGPVYQTPLTGWGAGAWGGGVWGVGGGGYANAPAPLYLWNQRNFGEDLVYGPRGGRVYYWDASVGVASNPVTTSIGAPCVVTLPAGVSIPDGAAVTFTTTGALPTGLVVGQAYFVVNSSGLTFNVSETLNGAPVTTSGAQSGVHTISPRGVDLVDIGDSDAPLFQNFLVVSDASRFILVFGTNDYGADYLDPMLIRWSNQEDPYTWTPAATNQAGSLRLSTGSKIVTAIQTRQEVVVFTDAALYSLQYQGAPFVWGAQLMGDNLSIAGPNSVALASGVLYWMGKDKFYKYDGRVQTLDCDLRGYVFSNINALQMEQVYAGTNEGFNEVWWFYCASNSTQISRYVVYNYLENVWYHGTMGRTAWLDSGLLPSPIAATYNNKLVQHEDGIDDRENTTPEPIEAHISSSEFDIGDGSNFGYVWRVLPDISFDQSQPAGVDGGVTYPVPQVTMTLYAQLNSGSGMNNWAAASVASKSSYNITEQYTGQVYTRARGRQMIFEMRSTQLGTTWRLGTPRIDVKPDGRR